MFVTHKVESKDGSRGQICSRYTKPVIINPSTIFKQKDLFFFFRKYNNMENIHLIDKDKQLSLKQMIESSDIEVQRLAVEILKNANFKESETLNNVVDLVGGSYYIYFTYSDLTKEFKFYTRPDYEKILKENNK